MRNLSFPLPNYDLDNVQGISFGDLDDEEWQTFLEMFKNLLPETLEQRKSMAVSKLRLGYSCQF